MQKKQETNAKEPYRKAQHVYPRPRDAGDSKTG